MYIKGTFILYYLQYIVYKIKLGLDAAISK